MNYSQRTAEWFQARVGKATASRFKDVMAKLKNGSPAAARITPGAFRFGVSERHDRLPGFAQTHVVGEDGPAPGEEEANPLDLVGGQAFGKLQGLLEGRVLDFGGWADGAGSVIRLNEGRS